MSTTKATTTPTTMATSTATKVEKGAAVDFSRCKVDELKEMCRAKGLKVGGSKAELIQRLGGPATATPTSKISKTTSTKAKTNTATTKATKNPGEKKIPPREAKVHKQLEAAGVNNPESVSRCLKKAIQTGFVKIDGPASLDQVIIEDKCDSCGGKVSAKVRDLLYQPDYGGDYEDGSEGATVTCPKGCYRTYVTRICQGKPQFDCGKFHNHCSDCKGFGTCIGDYRESHCDTCGKHYFSGLSGFGCPRCQPSDDSDDGSSEDEYYRSAFSGPRGRKRKEACLIM